MSDGITDSRKKLSYDEMVEMDIQYLKNLHRVMGETITQIMNRIEYKKEQNGTI